MTGNRKQYIKWPEFEAFVEWLRKGGADFETCEGDYEVLRWRHYRQGKPKPICYRRDVSDKITLNGEAAFYHKRYSQGKGVPMYEQFTDSNPLRVDDLKLPADRSNIKVHRGNQVPLVREDLIPREPPPFIIDDDDE